MENRPLHYGHIQRSLNNFNLVSVENVLSAKQYLKELISKNPRYYYIADELYELIDQAFNIRKNY